MSTNTNSNIKDRVIKVRRKSVLIICPFINQCKKFCDVVESYLRKKNFEKIICKNPQSL